ncbi:50S ribosomal protein L11 [Candidatus Saccharibacteria bacterium]|nr:50S ribosomal protein L11 [Candidatus Saccharibacteria bacterium]
MAKEVTANLKLRIPAGKASAGPPVGSTLGQYGLNMMDFINPFNEQTKDMMGVDVIVHLRIYDDRSFDFTVIGEPADDMIRKAAGIQKGSAESHKDKVGKITDAQLTEIAEKKMSVLNANDIEGAKKVIAGTARSMGVEIEG